MIDQSVLCDRLEKGNVAVINIKTNTTYIATHLVINATNSANDERMVEYAPVGKQAFPMIFVREVSEFCEKFNLVNE